MILNMSCTLLGSLVLTGLLFAGVVVLSYLNAVGVEGIYEHDMAESTDIYSHKLIPPYWLFWIWAVLYSLQVIWMIFALYVSIRTMVGKMNYGVPIRAIACFGFASACMIGWLFAWDYHQLIVSFGLLTTATFAVMLSTYFAANHYTQNVASKCSLCTRFLYLFFFVNGLAALSGWLRHAAVLNLGLIATYHMGGENPVQRGVNADEAAILGLVSALILHAVHILYDFFVMFRHTYCVFGDYVVWIVVYAVYIATTVDFDDHMLWSTLLIVLVCLASLVTLAKMIVTACWSAVKSRREKAVLKINPLKLQ